ncbi:MAG: cytochrome c biogenesis protein CcsA [Deltaproteobacteria bacterium]|nr:cytochrome c biogenesis protein CcsA [Deltaproteobacteria bacterium]
MNLTRIADLILVVTALAYAVASGLYFLQLAGRQTGTRVARPILASAATLQLVHFFVTNANAKACPINSVNQATSLMALVATTIFLFVSRVKKLEVVGAFVAPQALAAILAARLVGAPDTEPAVRTAVLPLHITSILVASALFAVASALAATYLLQEKQLKKKKTTGLLQRLPALDVLDRASHRFLLAGFPLLTIGILTGLLWIGHVNTNKLALLRQLLGYTAWILFAVVLLMRSAGGWRGRRAAWGTIVGFCCAFLVYVFYLVRNATGVG